MSLKVYERGTQPVNTIVSNDAFFNSRTSLDNTEKVRELLLKIDDAVWLSPETFLCNKHKEWGGIFKNNLSTGMKTVLNIIAYKDVCFDTIVLFLDTYIQVKQFNTYRSKSFYILIDIEAFLYMKLYF